MEFTKMHGSGNDYVYVEQFTKTLNNPPEFARLVAPRHYGVGSDGLITISPSAVADFRLNIYNPDGTQGEMCGNGAICCCKYFYEKGFTKKSDLTIESLAGIKTAHLNIENGKVYSVTIGMGNPITDYSKVPALISTRDNMLIDYNVFIIDRYFRITSVSMGNPHTVTFVDDAESIDIKKYGAAIEALDIFPRKTNVEFCRVIDRTHIFQRTWERNCGETWACGTGSSSVTLCAYLLGLAENEVNVTVRGGGLRVKYDKADNTITITGKGEIVFDGNIEYHNIKSEAKNEAFQTVG